MANIFYFLATLFCFLGNTDLVTAQKIQKKTELYYRFSTDSDSFLQHSKIFEYDLSERLIKANELYFTGLANKTPVREVFKNFDTTKMILSEIINKYEKDKTESERLKIKYLVYSADEGKNKQLYKQYFDNMDELMKEDTLIYDKNNNLLSRCEYDYRGNTSKYCDVYNYNRKNQLIRWRMYVYWTTVNMVSKAVTKKAKRQDYRYNYNSKGQPVSSYGKRYSAFFKELYSYDDGGRIKSYIQKRTRIIKPSKKKSKETAKTDKARITKNIDLIIRNYQYGKPVFEQQVNNNVENQRVETKYLNDTLIFSQVIFNKGVKIKQIDYEYSSLNKLIVKASKNFDEKGNVRNTIKSIYNEKGQLESELNYIKEILVGESTFAYDQSGNILSNIQFIKTRSGSLRKSEATYFLYELQ